MATVSRIAKINLSGATGSREWLATAAVQDTAAGAALSITVTQTTSGLTPPETANAVREMSILNESGGVIATYTWAEGAASTNFTHYLTSNGLVGGTPLADTFEILLRVQRTTGGPTSTYNVESDGSPNVPPTLFTSTLDRGWIRSTTTVTTAVSNIALGGGKTLPAQFADVLYVRNTLGAASSIARALTVDFTGSSKTKASSAVTSAVKDVTFSGTGIANGRVNEGFPAAASSYVVTVGTPSNSAFTGQPWTVLSRTDDSIDVDPRLTATHLFQLDNNSFATPPYAGRNADNERPSTSIAYFATHFRAARGVIAGDAISEGVNGLSIDIDLVAQSNGDTVSRSTTTITVNGEDGWTDDFMQWTSPLPGGGWDKTVEVTSPADINASGYVLNTTAVYQLIASRSPFVSMLVDAGHSSAANNDRHLHVGDTMEIATWLLNSKTGESRLLPFDESGITPEVSIQRSTGTGVTNWNGSAFVAAGGVAGDVIWLPMTKAADGFRWIYSVASDETWGDVIIMCRGQYLAVQYDRPVAKEFVGLYNRHDDPFTPLLLWVPTTDRGNHFNVGDQVIISFSLFAPDGTAAPTLDSDPLLTVLRVTASLGLEYLDAALAWQTFVDLDSAYQFTMTGGSLTLSDTTGFDTSDLILVATSAVGGEPVGVVKEIEIVDGKNKHSKNAFDAVGYATKNGFPLK